MLKAPADFPYPGSEALLGERRVRIIRVEPDGRRLVQGIGRPLLTRTVELAQLSDASLPDQPMDRWYAERATALEGDACPTPTEDLYRDFVTFARARGVEEFQTPSRMAFGHFLNLNGHGAIVRKVDGRAQRCVSLQLLPLQVAA